MDYGSSTTSKVRPSPHLRGDDTPDLCGIVGVPQFLVPFRILTGRMRFQIPRHLSLLPIFMRQLALFL